MDLGAACELVEHFEGCILHSYQDSVGVWTIGFGTTFIDSQPVTRGMTCTLDQAKTWLKNDVLVCAKKIEQFCHVALTDNELSALISFSYNVGLGGLERSQLMKKLNTNHPLSEVANEFLKWTKAKGRVLRGLVNRRKEERLLFLTPDQIEEHVA